MVISKDVWTLVDQEASSFQTMRLMNLTFVINGFDFMHVILRDFEIDCTFGGEYSQMAARFEQVLKKIVKCNLKPIFVFGGCTKSTVSIDIVLHMLSFDFSLSTKLSSNKLQYTLLRSFNGLIKWL